MGKCCEYAKHPYRRATLREVRLLEYLWPGQRLSATSVSVWTQDHLKTGRSTQRRSPPRQGGLLVEAPLRSHRLVAPTGRRNAELLRKYQQVGNELLMDDSYATCRQTSAPLLPPCMEHDTADAHTRKLAVLKQSPGREWSRDVCASHNSQSTPSWIRLERNTCG